jgi:DME family drug/metabolite transporter
MTTSGMPAHRGAVLVLVAAALFGTIGTARALGPDVPALPVAAARSALGSALLAAVALTVAVRAADRGLAGVDRALRTPAVWAAAVTQAGFQWAFLAAIPRVGVAVGTLLAIGATPLIAGALTRRADRRWLVATGIGLLGLVLLVGVGGLPDPVGLVLAFGAAVCYACYLIASNGIAAVQHRHELRIETSLAVVFTLVAALLLVPALATGPWAWLSSTSGVAMTTYLAVVPTLLAYSLLNRGLGVVPAGTAATLGLTEPVVATVLGIVLLGERLTAVSSLGAALVLVAVLVLVRAPATLPAADAQ